LAADNSFFLFSVDIPFMRTADHKLARAESLIKSLKIFCSSSEKREGPEYLSKHDLIDEKTKLNRLKIIWTTA
jgi:hypothetical protein